MLGFAPISAAPISGLSSVLIAVPVYGSATGGIVFSGTADTIFALNASAHGGLIFSGTAQPSWYQSVSATGGITFGGSAELHLAGLPIKFIAMPESYLFTAERANVKFHAMGEDYTFRGVLQ